MSSLGESIVATHRHLPAVLEAGSPAVMSGVTGNKPAGAILILQVMAVTLSSKTPSQLFIHTGGSENGEGEGEDVFMLVRMRGVSV